MDSWERFNETLPPKKSFYIELNLEDLVIKIICMLKTYGMYLK